MNCFSFVKLAACVILITPLHAAEAMPPREQTNDVVVYGVEWNGNQVGILHHQHFFEAPVDPFKTPGDPQSGFGRFAGFDSHDAAAIPY